MWSDTPFYDRYYIFRIFLYFTVSNLKMLKPKRHYDFLITVSMLCVILCSESCIKIPKTEIPTTYF